MNPRPEEALGSAAGGAVDGFARGLAIDMAPILLNSVCSGAVKTEVNASITLSSDTLTEYHAALEYAPTRGATKTICDPFKVFSCQARSLSG